MHNSLIALTASLHKFLFRFSQTIAFLSLHTCFSFTMYVYVSSPCFMFFCHHSIPVCSRRLSRVILPHIFSCLVSTQFTVCMTYFTLQTFLFCFPQTIAFSQVHLCLNTNTSEHILLPCFMHLQGFHPSVPP